MKSKPRLFIGSSKESIRIGYAIQGHLEEVTEATVWTQGSFALSTLLLDNLITETKRADFAVFVFSPDDVTQMRGQQSYVVRDNVLLELGLFIGRLGRERCYLLLPKDQRDLHLSTDLLGMTHATYETRTDDNWEAATGNACSKIRESVKRLGPVLKEGGTEREDLGNRLGALEERLNQTTRDFQLAGKALREFVEDGRTRGSLTSVQDKLGAVESQIRSGLETISDKLAALERSPRETVPTPLQAQQHNGQSGNNEQPDWWTHLNQEYTWIRPAVWAIMVLLVLGITALGLKY